MKFKYVVSVGAAILAILHTIWPKLNIDLVTVTLLVLALVPWLAPMIRSIELPGGVKVQFNELESMREKAGKAGLLQTRVDPLREYSFQLVADEDPRLALAGLRIELEQRLSDIAERKNLRPRHGGVGILVRTLHQAGVLSHEQTSALNDMIGLLNRAVHGAQVDPRAAEWALDIGPKLLATLEQLRG
ncbi:MAG: hypothetical protein AB1609_16285 [Bacillota bacterium]